MWRQKVFTYFFPMIYDIQWKTFLDINFPFFWFPACREVEFKVISLFFIDSIRSRVFMSHKSTDVISITSLNIIEINFVISLFQYSENIWQNIPMMQFLCTNLYSIFTSNVKGRVDEFNVDGWFPGAITPRAPAICINFIHSYLQFNIWHAFSSQSVCIQH